MLNVLLAVSFGMCSRCLRDVDSMPCKCFFTMKKNDNSKYADIAPPQGGLGVDSLFLRCTFARTLMKKWRHSGATAKA